MLGLLLAKEVRLLLREPTVRAALVVPFVVYATLGVVLGGAAEQVRGAAELEGLRVAVVGEGPGCALAGLVASLLSARGAEADAVCDAEPAALLAEYPVVLAVRGPADRLELEAYVRASLSEIVRGMALPLALARGLGDANVTVRGFVLLGGRLWELEELGAVFNTGLWLTYAAAVAGAEREERMLETLLSLPVSRRSIAAAKVISVVVVASLVALSALAGMYVMVWSAGREVALALEAYGAWGLAVYGAALVSTVAMVSALSTILGLFASSHRGAQALSGAAALPLLAALAAPMAGLPESPAAAVAPYLGLAYAALAPLAGPGLAAPAAAAQACYAALALAALARLLESEVAVTGPETLKQLLARLRRRG